MENNRQCIHMCKNGLYHYIRNNCNSITHALTSNAKYILPEDNKIYFKRYTTDVLDFPGESNPYRSSVKSVGFTPEHLKSFDDSEHIHERENILKDHVLEENIDHVDNSHSIKHKYKYPHYHKIPHNLTKKMIINNYSYPYPNVSKKNCNYC